MPTDGQVSAIRIHSLGPFYSYCEIGRTQQFMQWLHIVFPRVKY